MANGPTFEELATPLFGQLYDYAHWLTRDGSEAEDLVQETYLKAFRGFGSFSAGTNFRAWIYRILRNTFLTSRTGLRAAPQISIDEDPDEYEQLGDRNTPESLFLGRFTADALRRAIEELPLPFREVLLLSDVENMSYKEIAETLSIPVGTVTSRLMRARRRVRDALRGIR
ncbi:MAG TPA: sigma-70 family RNA polymerase sigma factor [Thermoanaerobaculia bacterium]|jgi:RNA polymerase sigma-70 factor (ECF subfamily)|nr:sigma-70 family RNA polymerase sigma factor [Thermoanaerobaculia bacterium]